MGIVFNRIWAMPSADTFDIAPIGDLVRRYLRQSKVSVDPFARNKRWATHTNDLNPQTSAEYHMHALEFLTMLHDKGIVPDLIIFDPPYSPHQTKECYAGFGISMRYSDDGRNGWSKTRKLMSQMLSTGGVVISCGWNTVGAGGESMAVEEVLDVCHGIGHNDTICMVERKLATQQSFFGAFQQPLAA